MEEISAKLKRWVDRAAISIAAALFVSVLLSFLFPWSAVNCWQSEVDIYSGRLRYSYFLYGFPVYRSVQDSWLTRALSAEKRGRSHESWQRVSLTSPGLGYSPHFAYHLAIGQISSLHNIWQSMKYTPEAQRESARRVLQLWQRDRDNGGAEEYIQSLREEAIKAGARGPL